jgi:hypothetical protein
MMAMKIMYRELIGEYCDSANVHAMDGAPQTTDREVASYVRTEESYKKSECFLPLDSKPMKFFSPQTAYENLLRWICVAVLNIS